MRLSAVFTRFVSRSTQMRNVSVQLLYPTNIYILRIAYAPSMKPNVEINQCLSTTTLQLEFDLGAICHTNN